MTYTAEQLEAVQHAVERVGANWDGATTQTITEKLRPALAESGVDVDDADLAALAQAIEREQGTVDVTSVL